ncbi:MAG: hypothetical protein M1820_002331 [Bogoriella megaspora]|nr:MAG: hypothetical protein M1820_002331 [Bogoriella megaspora]
MVWNLTKSHNLEVFNDSIFPPSSAGSFTLFARLPTELRLKIWEAFVHRNHFIKVTALRKISAYSVCRNDGWDPPSDYYKRKNKLGKIISGINHLVVCACLHTCPLLRVNHEARRVSLTHYRVRLPCRLVLPVNEYREDKSEAEISSPAVLAINPEWDVIWIREYAYDFMHDLRAYDPRHKGVLNLAWDAGNIPYYAALAKPEDVQDPTKREDLVDVLDVAVESMREIIAKLNVVFWVANYEGGNNSEGRMITREWKNPTLEGIAPWYNISMPLLCESPGIVNLGPDPRLHEADKRYVWTGIRQMHEVEASWRQLEANLAITLEQLQFRWLVTSYDRKIKPSFRNERLPITDRASADKYLCNESSEWLQAIEHDKKFRGSWEAALKRYAPDMLRSSPQEMVCRYLPRTTWGFWSFKANADFGEIHHQSPFKDLTQVEVELWVSELR